MGNLNLLGGGESHKSNIAQYGEDFDPTSWITKGIGADFLNPHKYIKPATNKLNEWIGTVTKPINQLNTKIEPGAAMLNQTPIGKQWNQTIENRPVDAAAMVLGAIFGGGALMGAGGAAGAAGAPAASGGAGAMGGLGGMSGAASAITPTFASGVGAGSGVASGLGYSGLGTLGASGTAAANSMLPSLGSFSSMGGAGVGGSSLFGNMSAYDKINNAKRLADALRNGIEDYQKAKSGYQNTYSPIGSYHNYHMPRSQ